MSSMVDGPGAIRAEAPAPVMLIIAAVGVGLISWRHPIARLFAAHPFVPSPWRRGAYVLALSMLWFLGGAYVAIGAAGFVLALVQ